MELMFNITPRTLKERKAEQKRIKEYLKEVFPDRNARVDQKGKFD